MAEEVVSLIDPEPPDRYRFDYKGMHRYYITLPVFASKRVFTGQQNVLRVLDCLRETALNHLFDVYAYCFLPDSLFMIVRGRDDKADMKEFLSAFRKLSAETLHPVLGHPLWKKKYLERVLRKTEETRLVAEAMFQLPVKAGVAQNAEEYPFHGSFVVTPKPKSV